MQTCMHKCLCAFTTHLSGQILGSFTLLLVASQSRLLQCVSVSSGGKEEKSLQSVISALHRCETAALSSVTGVQVSHTHRNIISMFGSLESTESVKEQIYNQIFIPMCLYVFSGFFYGRSLI